MVSMVVVEVLTRGRRRGRAHQIALLKSACC